MTAFLALCFVVSNLGIFQVFAIGSMGVTPLEFTIMLFMLAVPFWMVWTGTPLRIPRGPEITVMVLLLASMTVSTISPVFYADSIRMVQSFKTLSHFIFMWSFGVVLWCIPVRPRAWIDALRLHLAVSIVICLFGAYQIVARALDLPLAWIDITNTSFIKGQMQDNELGQLSLQFANLFRATSIFSEPSALATYSSINLALLVIPIFRGSAGILKTRWVQILAIVSALIALLLAFSLTGLMLTGAVMVLAMVLYRQAAWKRVATVVAMSTVVIVIADRVVESYADVSVVELFAMRVSSIITGKASSGESGTIVGESLTQRTGDYAASIEVWKESPLLGVGPGNFANSNFGRAYSSPYPATTYGTVISEMGVVGIAVFLVFLLVLFGRLLLSERQWTRDHRADGSDLERLAPILPFILLITIFVCLNGNLLVSAYWWLFFAFVLNVHTELRRSMGEDTCVTVRIVRTGLRDRWRGALQWL